jgi:hypothetical protein
MLGNLIVDWRWRRWRMLMERTVGVNERVNPGTVFLDELAR